MDADPPHTMIPYTHWAYFPAREAAQSCADELNRKDFLAAVDATVDPTPGIEWLMRAAKNVRVGDMVQRHGEVEEVVVRHGGEYDGGESGWLDLTTGRFLESPEG